jgi:hypothetical protein
MVRSRVVDHAAAKQALLTLQTNGVVWAEGGGQAHLWKRLDAMDLNPGTTMEEFDALVRSIAEDSAAHVYLDEGDTRLGGAIWVLGTGAGREAWLVKVHAGGEVRTAFPRVAAEDYLYDKGSR